MVILIKMVHKIKFYNRQQVYKYYNINIRLFS